MRLAPLLLALMLSAPSFASAQDDVLGGPDLCQTSSCGGWLFFGAIVGTAALAVDTALIIEGIDKAAQGHGLYEHGAMFELFWGVAHLGAAAALLGHARADQLGVLAPGLPLAILGTYFVVHGALSLTSARPPPPEEEDEDAPYEAEGQATAALTVAPTWGGATVSVFGRF